MQCKQAQDFAHPGLKESCDKVHVWSMSEEQIDWSRAWISTTKACTINSLERSCSGFDWSLENWHERWTERQQPLAGVCFVKVLCCTRHSDRQACYQLFRWLYRMEFVEEHPPSFTRNQNEKDDHRHEEEDEKLDADRIKDGHRWRCRYWHMYLCKVLSFHKIFIYVYMYLQKRPLVTLVARSVWRERCAHIELWMLWDDLLLLFDSLYTID